MLVADHLSPLSKQFFSTFAKPSSSLSFSCRYTALHTHTLTLQRTMRIDDKKTNLVCWLSTPSRPSLCVNTKLPLGLLPFVSFYQIPAGFRFGERHKEREGEGEGAAVHTAPPPPYLRESHTAQWCWLYVCLVCWDSPPLLPKSRLLRLAAFSINIIAPGWWSVSTRASSEQHGIRQPYGYGQCCCVASTPPQCKFNAVAALLVLCS